MTLHQRFKVQPGRWHEVPIGLHTAAMHQSAFDVASLAVLVPWLALHRAGLSVLVHPNAPAVTSARRRHGRR